MADRQICKFCGQLVYNHIIQFGPRDKHFAHYSCYRDSGRSPRDLSTEQQRKFRQLKQSTRRAA
jgi:hypothetical protein